MHLIRILRILTIPGGNGLFLGIAGSGKQSLTKLAIAMVGQSMFQPEINKNYSMQNWQSDLKNMLKEAGCRKIITAFLISDHQIVQETFLEDIDNLLNSGEIPNLFDIEDKVEITEAVQTVMQTKDKTVNYTPLELFSQFVNFCRENLHIIIAMNPLRDIFRYRVQQFPSLVNCCTIDWFEISQ